MRLSSLLFLFGVAVTVSASDSAFGLENILKHAEIVQGSATPPTVGPTEIAQFDGLLATLQAEIAAQEDALAPAKNIDQLNKFAVEMQAESERQRAEVIQKGADQVWAEWENKKIPESMVTKGAEPTNGPVDVTTAAPIPVDETTTAAPIPVDETTTAAPIPVDETTTAAPIPVDETTTAAPIPVDETTTAAPIPVDETTTAAPIQVDETTTAAPIQVDETTTAAPIPVDETTTAAPIQVDDTTTAAPIPVDETTTAAPIPVDETTTAAPIPVDETTTATTAEEKKSPEGAVGETAASNDFGSDKSANAENPSKDNLPIDGSGLRGRNPDKRKKRGLRSLEEALSKTHGKKNGGKHRALRYGRKAPIQGPGLGKLLSDATGDQRIVA